MPRTVTMSFGSSGWSSIFTREPAHVRVDQAAVAQVVVPPHPLQQLVPGEHHVGVVGELAQQEELGLGERQRLARLEHHTLLPAQLQVAEDASAWAAVDSCRCTRRRRARMRAASSLMTTGLVT